MQDRENADCRRNVGKTEKMRSRRRKRRGSGLWPGAVAVLAAGMVFAARTEILDLAKTGIDLVVDDDHQENSAEKPDLSVTENSDAAADGEETLTDAGANSTDETGADRKYMDADSEISADGSGEQEFIELPSSYDLREHRAIRVSDQGDLGTCWAFAALKAVETSMPESMAVPLSADHMSIHNSFGISQNSGGDYSMAMAYLLAWQGPVSEADDPYGDSISPDGLAPVCHVQEIRILQAKDYGAVKRAVFLYGGVQTSLYLPAENRGGDGNVCYKGSEEPNHDTVIIGRKSSHQLRSRTGRFSASTAGEKPLGMVDFFMSPTRTDGSRRAVSPIAGSSRRIIMTGITRVISADGPVRWAMESRTHGWRTCIQQSRRRRWRQWDFMPRRRTRNTKCMCLTGTVSVNMWKTV